MQTFNHGYTWVKYMITTKNLRTAILHYYFKVYFQRCPDEFKKGALECFNSIGIKPLLTNL